MLYEQGTIIWRFVSPRKEFVQKIASSLTDLNIKFSLTKLQALDELDTLTSRQEHIVKIAYDNGYYDFPKGTGIREIAKIAGVSTATVSETLRRATRRLIKNYYYHEDIV